MMYRRFRSVMADERGQALVLGAVGLLAMALMVTASVSLGNAVYQKIKLQDAADAQSYSIAVKEARAYNFFAYANRAMVVHYCAMLTFMSYLSHAYYLNETVGKMAKYLKQIPYIGTIFAAVEAAIKAWLAVVDVIAMAAIPVLTALNAALWLAEEALVAATWLSIFSSDQSDPIRKTDPKAKAGVQTMGSSGGIQQFYNFASNVGLNWMNADNFLHPIDDGIRGSYGGTHGSTTGGRSGFGVRAKLFTSSNKLSVVEMYKYRMLMGNIANSARREWTAVGKGPWLIGRKWSLNLCLVFGQIKISKVADSQIRSMSEDYENNRRDQLWAMEDIVIRARWGCSWPFKWKTLFSYKIRVAADNKSGYHQVGFGTWAQKKDKHHWWSGIAPFILNDTSYFNPWSYTFGEPDNLVVVTKKMPKNVFDQKFTLKPVEGTLDKNGELNTTFDDLGKGNGLDNAVASYLKNRTGGGLMAVAAGRAVYHRPGDWKEEPNFFNPLWTARLSSVETNWEMRNRLEALLPELPIMQKWLLDDTFNY